MKRNTRALLWLALASLVMSPSCVVMHERNGEGYSKTYASLGGRGTYLHGQGLSHDHDRSFRDGVIGAVMLGGSYFGAATAKAKEITAQKAAAEQTKRHAASEVTRQAGISANAEAYSAGLGAEVQGIMPATPPPPITP